ncbi:MAG: bifunctional phosphoribosylaminoimidazolecarboxamide formyltransferase/IMP cyclohydrolase [bacterium]
MIKIKRVLISVSDKEELIPFAKALAELGIEIIASGGTSKTLKESGIPASSIDEVTGHPEILGGRVKTLHPVIFGAILAKREESHLLELEKQGIKPIDMVVCNLYPFEERIKSKINKDEAIEEIDIGGVTLIRAGAKNNEYVATIIDKRQYAQVISILKNKGGIPEDFSYSLAKEAFSYIARYDTIISNWFLKEEFPEMLNLSLKKAIPLRYGENPHQAASFYVQDKPLFTQISGDSLSYNNILDLDSALKLAFEFEKPSCVIIKHNTPCGVACSEDIYSAYKLAFEADPISAFGGIIAINRPLSLKTADAISKTFYEGIIAPDFEDNVVELFKDKKVRIVKSGARESESQESGIKIQGALGGFLIQEEDGILYKDISFPTKKRPSNEEMEDLIFAYKVCKYVKSNAIVIAKNKKTLGICGGQTNRVDAVKIAIERAGNRAKGGYLASDAFFPFSDSVELAGKAGISAIIQPGGSIRDNDAIEKAESFGISMVFANIRHFRH